MENDQLQLDIRDFSSLFSAGAQAQLKPGLNSIYASPRTQYLGYIPSPCPRIDPVIDFLCSQNDFYPLYHSFFLMQVEIVGKIVFL